MKILLVYPQYPETFWSFKYSLSFIRKKALIPPLGLITIASMLPENFETRLVDLNIEPLTDKDLLWADFVFISAMITQRESVVEVGEKCRELNIITVGGGPLFTNLYEEFPDINYFVLDEGEITLPMFLEDLKNNNLKKIYRSSQKPDIKTSPIPRWDLIKQKEYVRMPVQYSRGCPFDCEFCDVVKLNGRIPRTKTPLQVVKELNAMLRSGWRGPVFFVDDNFIGNKENTKHLLKKIYRWRKLVKTDMTFMTEASLNVSDDEELMLLLRKAGFNSLFIGIETPSEESLQECGKFQNKNRCILDSVRILHKKGFDVSAGFIVGFDNDDPGIFQRQIEFIQKSGIVIAMVGILQALPGTRLYERLKRENRLFEKCSGNNTDFSINFIPKLDSDILLEGYREIVRTVYSGKEYYNRVLTFINNYNHHTTEAVSPDMIFALFKSVIYMGILDQSRLYYWRTFFKSLMKHPRYFAKFIAMSIYYAHFKRVFMN